MADNIDVTPGTGKTIAADEVGAVLYQRVKISVGVQDVAPTDLAFGAAAAAASLPVTQSTEDAARVGSLTETAPSTDTASSGLNGRLQRVAQRLSSLIGLVPTSLATGGGLRVTVQDTAGTALDYTVPALVGGDIAHDSPISSQKPVVVGARAATALPTAVADADVTRLMADKFGRLIARAALRENIANAAITFSSATTTALIAADASNKNDIFKLVLTNTGANAAKAVLKDGTTVVDTFQIPPAETRGFCVSVDSATPQAAVNTAWNVTVSGTSPALEVSCSYVKNGG